MSNYTDADEKTLLSQPGYLYYRPYASSGAWTKAVFMNGATYTPSVESTAINFDDVGNVRDEVSDETVEVGFSTGRVLDLDTIHDLTGGLYNKTSVAGTLVSGAIQTTESGNWNYDTIILVENQNSDLGETAITSLTGSVDGALAEGTDYELVKLSEIGWGIAINSGVSVTTELQDLVLVYDYTPSAKTIITRGGTKIINPIQLAYQTTDSDGDYVQFFFYKCVTNGADGHGFSPELSADPVTMDLAFTAKKDTNRASGDQLMSIVAKADGSLG